VGHFDGKINAEFTPPKTWVLSKSLSFTSKKLNRKQIMYLEKIGANIVNSGKITCKEGMKTDLASVPRICWAFIAPWDVARGAVIHDHLYASLRKYYHGNNFHKSTWKKARAISDKVFLLGMNSAEPSVPKWKKYAAYYSVRLCGGGPASAKEN
tara:strand:+ start:1267 stop:1728 length:462 start_codon:yes stop_codon:yes gene_type:complete